MNIFTWKESLPVPGWAGRTHPQSTIILAEASVFSGVTARLPHPSSRVCSKIFEETWILFPRGILTLGWTLIVRRGLLWCIWMRTGKGKKKKGLDFVSLATKTFRSCRFSFWVEDSPWRSHSESKRTLQAQGGSWGRLSPSSSPAFAKSLKGRTSGKKHCTPHGLEHSSTGLADGMSNTSQQSKWVNCFISNRTEVWRNFFSPCSLWGQGNLDN